MLEILAYSLIALVVAIAAILALATMRPDDFKVSRSLAIAAKPEQLFPLIANLRRMNTWNPYSLRDSSSTTSYTGPDAGKGATHVFDGKKSGSGSIEVVETTAPSSVVMRLRMHKPFTCDNRVEFTLKPNGGGATDVTWSMAGKQPLLIKAMNLVFDSSKMVGRDMDEGLGNLKRMAEGV